GPGDLQRAGLQAAADDQRKLARVGRAGVVAVPQRSDRRVGQPDVDAMGLAVVPDAGAAVDVLLRVHLLLDVPRLVSRAQVGAVAVTVQRDPRVGKEPEDVGVVRLRAFQAGIGAGGSKLA